MPKKQTSTKRTINLRNNYPENDKVNAWLDKQDNISKSTAFLICYLVDRIGYATDIFDMDVQKMLFSDLLGGNDTHSQSTTAISNTNLNNLDKNIHTTKNTVSAPVEVEITTSEKEPRSEFDTLLEEAAKNI